MKNQRIQIAFGCAVALTVSLVSVPQVFAQSGTKKAAPRAMNHSAMQSKASAAVDGYCPVCVMEMKKWVKGNSQFSVTHDGKTYLFPGEDQRQMFLKNPAKYTPVMGGDCVVAHVEMGKRVAGKPHFAAIHQSRLYLFSEQKGKDMFIANREKYIQADLAIDGKCSVCRVEMNKDVAGSPKFTSLYKGLRYQFPSEKQQMMFDKNPAKYEVMMK